MVHNTMKNVTEQDYLKMSCSKKSNIFNHIENFIYNDFIYNDIIYNIN